MTSKLLGALAQNAGVKVLAVLISVALYFLVRSDSVKELEVEVPVALSGLRDDVVVTGDIPSSVRLRLRGRWSRLLRVLEQRPAPYELSLSALADGEMHSFDEARLRQLVGASSLDLTTIEPPGVLVRFEPKIKRRVPVRVEFVGEPAEGYEFDPALVRFQPLTVEVAGAKSSVEGIESVVSTPVQLTGVSRDLQADVPLQRPDKAHVEMKPDRISVQLPIRERQVSDELVAVQVYIRNCAPMMRCIVQPSRVKVGLRGALRRVRELKELGEEQMIFVDAFVESQKPGTYSGVPVQAKRFEGVAFELEPNAVTLDVQTASFPSPPSPVPDPLLLPPLPDSEGAGGAEGGVDGEGGAAGTEEAGGDGGTPEGGGAESPPVP